MFILLLTSPLLLLSLIWNKFAFSSQTILRFLFVILFSLFFTSYYLNGMDWSIYYLKFVDEGDPYSSFEFGFVLFFEGILFLTNNNYGLAILLFYLITFSILCLIIKRFKTNEPLFWACLFLIFGYNLILEQLRQFIACIIIFYALLKYNNDGKINWLIFWIFLAACFHVSSLIVFPAIALASFRNVTTFTLLTLVSIVGFIGFFFTGAAIVTALANANLAFTKIAYYLQQNPISLSFGWLNILDLIFVLFYFIYRASIDRVASVRLLTRLIFVGATIHLFSGSITFLARVCFFFYFIAIYVFCVVPKGESTRLFSIRSYNTLILALFFSGMLTLNFISYFRNEQAPLQFSNMTFRLLSFFEDDYVRKLANDKYYDATQDMNNIL
ncbi:FIG00638365: hypothetical protein [Cronobacter sakazakii 696]|nr:FIG00638365: hypothetical protein [Cronobacter sakazakii 696]